ncbi:hypothetical protein AAHC03_013724 [Spirometra sp. Aus1]
MLQWTLFLSTPREIAVSHTASELSAHHVKGTDPAADKVGQRMGMPPFYTTGVPQTSPTGFSGATLPGHPYEGQSRPPPRERGAFDANCPPPPPNFSQQCPPSSGRNYWDRDNDRSPPDLMQQRF